LKSKELNKSEAAGEMTALGVIKYYILCTPVFLFWLIIYASVDTLIWNSTFDCMPCVRLSADLSLCSIWYGTSR